MSAYSVEHTVRLSHEDLYLVLLALAGAETDIIARRGPSSFLADDYADLRHRLRPIYDRGETARGS